jgi:hypothetical protein
MLSKFPFGIPRGYVWLIESGIDLFKPGSFLAPWYILPEEQIFDVGRAWPGSFERGRLFAFARRQDCDELACFLNVGGVGNEVRLANGWTPSGCDVDRVGMSFWDWVRSVIEVVEGRVDLDDP